MPRDARRGPRLRLRAGAEWRSRHRLRPDSVDGGLAGRRSPLPPSRPPLGSWSARPTATSRCLDRATGVSLWTHQTGDAVQGACARRRGAPAAIYLGTTDRRILELKLDKGEARLGAGRSVPTSSPRGSSCPDRVCSTPRSTPCSTACSAGATSRGAARCPRGRCPAPSGSTSSILVACHENEILGFDLADRVAPLGSLRTAAEISNVSPSSQAGASSSASATGTVVAYARCPKWDPTGQEGAEAAARVRRLTKGRTKRADRRGVERAVARARRSRTAASAAAGQNTSDLR